MKARSLLLCSALLFTFHGNAQLTFYKTYGDSRAEQADAVKQCVDGGYIITGFRYNTPQYNVFLVRTNASGDTLWTRTYGGDNMVGFDVIQTADSNFVLTGYKNSSSPKVYLKKIDQNGATIWTQVIGAIGNWGQAVQETHDGGFIIGGAALYKTDNL